MAAPRTERAEILNNFLASALIFSNAMTELIEDQIRKVLGKDFTLPQVKLLLMVARTNAGTISEVAAFLGVSNAAASKAVDRLVRRGLLQRREKESDRRAVCLLLTEEGRRVLQQYDEAQNGILDRLFQQFSPDSFVETSTLLDELSANLVDVGARPDELCFRCGIYFREKCLLRKVSRRVCYYHLHKSDVRKKRIEGSGPVHGPDGDEDDISQ
jgi:DNA-binding MarR family transcriptional regulator